MKTKIDLGKSVKCKVYESVYCSASGSVRKSVCSSLLNSVCGLVNPLQFNISVYSSVGDSLRSSINNSTRWRIRI